MTLNNVIKKKEKSSPDIPAWFHEGIFFQRRPSLDLVSDKARQRREPPAVRICVQR